MQRKFKFAPGEFYHIYSRGVDKRNIFLEDLDKDRFIKLIYACNSEKPVVFKTIQRLPLEEIDRGETIVDTGAYCLMPNHFHFLMREKKENGISAFLEKILTAYSKYFNKKYNRTGRLFESNFKAQHANDDNYLKYLFAYIHLNPVKNIEPEWTKTGISDKEKAKNFLDKYRHSSYLDYIEPEEKRSTGVILEKSAFPEYFEKPKDFEDFVDDWLSWKEESNKSLVL